VEKKVANLSCGGIMHAIYGMRIRKAAMPLSETIHSLYLKENSWMIVF
jgi:hypothetical protein|tara:strand:- start:9 stop:152 length:144 start_codon:yes stop_codon:yes gene_type:complete